MVQCSFSYQNDLPQITTLSIDSFVMNRKLPIIIEGTFIAFCQTGFPQLKTVQIKEFSFCHIPSLTFKSIVHLLLFNLIFLN